MPRVEPVRTSGGSAPRGSLPHSRGRAAAVLFGLGIAIGLGVVFRDPLLRAGGSVIYPFPYRDIVESAAASASVDPLLVVAVMREESGFVPEARSHAGAVGLMQLMPETARWMAAKARRAEGDLQDPDYNIRLGAEYLGYLQKQFDGDTHKVLAAYNGGEGNVKRWKDLSKAFPETRRYVQRSLITYRRYRWIYSETRP